MDVVLPKPGSYVVAVSGGVDSISLLHILSQQPGLNLIVAHLDHGIRPDSAEDQKLVQSVADELGLPFYYEKAKLGTKASEAAARGARYKFLNKVLQEAEAEAIITAHHQDDLIETAIINMLRGSGRKGLTSLSSRADVVRPLLNVRKQELVDYARQQGLRWREDSTNADDSYLRNYVRHKLVTKMDEPARQELLGIIIGLQDTNQEIDTLLVKYLDEQSVDGAINRQWFSQLPHAIAREVMASWLRASGIRNFDSKTLERLVVAAKTASAGRNFPILNGYFIEVNKDNLALKGPER